MRCSICRLKLLITQIRQKPVLFEGGLKSLETLTIFEPRLKFFKFGLCCSSFTNIHYSYVLLISVIIIFYVFYIQEDIYIFRRWGSEGFQSFSLHPGVVRYKRLFNFFLSRKPCVRFKQ